MKTSHSDEQRTIPQNKAIHKLFEMMAEALNDAGWDMRKTLKPEVDIPWSKDTIKEYMWKPVMKAQLNKESTTEMTKKDINKVFETLHRHFGEKFGLHITFPSIEQIIEEQSQ